MEPNEEVKVIETFVREQMGAKTEEEVEAMLNIFAYAFLLV